MILMGIGDEAANGIDGQIQATRELGWKYLEPRGVQVPGFPKANFHDIPEAAFDMAVRKLEAAGLGAYCFGSTIMNWAKKVTDPFDTTLTEVQRTIPRMRRTGAKFVRVMMNMRSLLKFFDESKRLQKCSSMRASNRCTRIA